MLSIDLNADLGEGFGRYRFPNDSSILAQVTSVNVACGFHAGDPVVMRETVVEAGRHGVAIGAHPGYPDLVGFGRREMGASPAEIEAMVIYQLGALTAVCTAAGERVRYVKPHGALYNRAVRDRAAAEAICRAIRAVLPTLPLLGLAGTEMESAATRASLPFAAEAFVDRAYRPDGALVSRTEPDAVLDDPAVCADRAARMVLDGLVEAVDGSMLSVAPASLCVHGDGPTALRMLQAVRTRLEQSGVRVTAFAR